MVLASLFEMQRPDLNSAPLPGRPAWRVVTAVEAVRVLFDREHRNRLASFVRGPTTVGAVAEALGEDPKRTFYFARRYVGLGLVEEVGRTPRRGRPIRTYRATADGWFVAIEHYPTVDLVEGLDEIYLPLARYLHRSIGAAVEPHLTRTWGRRVRLDGGGTLIPEGGPHPDAGDFDLFELYARPGFPPAWLSWQELELTDAEAKALQHELIEVVRRLEEKLRPGPARRKYLVHVGLAPALEDA
jgi:hypothetical protein